MKRVLCAALTVLFLCVCLAGCSSNPKSVSDQIISHINQSITDETKTTKNNFNFSEEFDTDYFHYIVYESKEPSESNEKDYTTKCSVVFEEGEFVAIKLETEMKFCDSYLYAKYSLYDLEIMQLYKEMPQSDFLDSLYDGSEIGNYTVEISEGLSSNQFLIYRSDTTRSFFL